MEGRERSWVSRPPNVGNRSSIWHWSATTSRSADPADSPVKSQPSTRRQRRQSWATVELAPLPPLGGSCSQTRFENNSPSARRAPDKEKSTQQNRRTAARRCWRTTPRPFAVQRLAGQLVARAHGLHRGHIGTVCDALTAAGIDPNTWTAKALCEVLDADMRATGWVWPNRIERPGAFLAWRLRRLHARCGDNHTSQGGSIAAARQDEEPDRAGLNTAALPAQRPAGPHRRPTRPDRGHPSPGAPAARQSAPRPHHHTALHPRGHQPPQAAKRASINAPLLRKVRRPRPDSSALHARPSGAPVRHVLGRAVTTTMP